MRLRAVALASLATLVGCAAAPPSAPAGPPAPSPSEAPVVAPPPAPPSASVAPSASAPVAASSAVPAQKAPEGPTHCPAGMKLVEGDYCTDVEHKCKKEWFDKSNKKVICEEFEPVAKCVGQKVKK